MRKQALFSFLLSGILIHELSGNISDSDADSICGCGPHSMRAAVRHIEANGVGYDKGYTTFEGFFAPSELWKDYWIPFLDLRMHVFNDARFAANMGIGTRFLSSRAWGINVYYDYRNTHHQSFNMNNGILIEIPMS